MNICIFEEGHRSVDNEMLLNGMYLYEGNKSEGFVPWEHKKQVSVWPYYNHILFWTMK